jgi:HAD superfamily hydrolase (TIGR01509 family)
MQKKLQLPAGDFRAYLFDCDGTLADSMPVHFRAWSTAVAEQGGIFPEDLFIAWGGIPLHTTVEMLNARFNLSMPIAETVHRKEELYFAMMSEIQPMHCVVAHVHAKHGQIPLAVVSGSPRASILKTLNFLGIADRFDEIVGAEDYTLGKPDPEPFLVAAQRLNVPPSQCLVFEDADAGIASAKAAGMSWVKVPQHSSGKDQEPDRKLARPS